MVVTGFSGTGAAERAQPRAANTSAIDLTFINPDGPSARIMAVGRPGYVWDASVFQAPKTFDVFARDTGQVFGVALDESARPTSTSPPPPHSASTSLVTADGQPERRKAGGPGTG